MTVTTRLLLPATKLVFPETETNAAASPAIATTFTEVVPLAKVIVEPLVALVALTVKVASELFVLNGVT